MGVPFTVKQAVLHGAINSVLLDGCESWCTDNLRCVDTAVLGCTDNLKCVDTAVLGCLKVMLGVRNQASSEAVYIETGATPISEEIRRRQMNFISKVRERDDFANTPLGRAIHLAGTVGSPMGVYYRKLLTLDANPTFVALDAIKQRVTSSDATRLVTYRSLKTCLNVHPVYTNNEVNELYRISFSRLRLSSHYLRIETGRWSWIPRPNRTCTCGNNIQTEGHVSCRVQSHKKPYLA